MSALRKALLCVLVVAAACATGCGDGGGTNGDGAAAGSRAPLQIANGPVQAATGTRPLTVRLERPDRLHVRFKHPPRSGLLVDLDTGEVLWRHQPTRVLPMASLTKMTTALLVTERLKGSDKAKVTKEALAYKGSGVGVLPRGKRVRVETLLYGLLLPSGNDAAIALAQRASGTVAGFVGRMNEMAGRMGLSCSRYTSPDGFQDAGNHSCAVDLAALARAVLDTPRLARIVRTRRTARPFPIKGGRLFLNNNNPLLRMGYPGTIGVKTGYTDKAGRCLVAAARRHGRRLGVVLLHSPDPGRQATQLLDRGFKLKAS